MTSIIGIAPLDSPSFSGVASFDQINMGQSSITYGTSYKVSSAVLAGSSTVTVTGSITLDPDHIYAISGTSIDSGCKVLSSTINSTDGTSTLTLSMATNGSLTTTSSVLITDIPPVELNFSTIGADFVNSSIIASGGSNYSLSGNLDLNATILNLNGSDKVNVSNSLGVGHQTMTPVSYTVSAAAATGSTSIVVTGELTLSDYATYYISGNGIPDNTLITNSVVDTTASTSTLTLTNATTSALTTASTVNISTNYETVIDIFASGTDTPDGSIGVLGGYGSGYSGIFNFSAGTFNFQGSSDINFAAAQINFKTPSYFESSVYVGTAGTASAMESLNFLTSGEVEDYDARIFCQGGSSTSGGGLLTLQADTVALAPGSGGFNIEGPSFNLGLNQSKLGSTFINFFSNGNNANWDSEISSYGGTTGANGGGTFKITSANLTVNAPYIDMTAATNGVMVPTLSAVDSSTKAASTAYVGDYYLPLTGGNIAGGLSLTSLFAGSINPESSSSNLTLYYGDSCHLSLQAGGNAVFYGSDNNPILVISPNNDVTYNYAPSTTTNSSIIATTSWVHSLVSSDPSLKENMVELSNNKSLTDLSKIKLYSFDWKDKERGHKEVGFNSKNLIQVWPDVVNQFKPDKDGIAPPDSIDVISLIARLTDCVKELKSEIEYLKSKYQ